MSIHYLSRLEFLPNKPGVYQFLNTQGEIIYVGKAKDLKKRVSSYFNRKTYESAKLRVLVSKVDDIKHIIVETESDALLLENNLIKKLKPRYNILLKDDKTYPWICIKKEPYPRIFSTRLVVQDGSRYFGPYTSGFLMKTILDLIRSLYPLRNCTHSLTEHYIKSGRFKPCLEYQIGNCMAPCIGLQDENSYNNNIDAIIEILKGNIQVVRRMLNQRMISLSKEFKFEEAQRFKEKIAALDRYQAKTTIVSQTHRDVDVFSIVNEKNYACVNFIKVINGSVIQSHNIELKKNLDESEGDLLGYAIAELRQRVRSRAKEIIVPLKPDFTLSDCKYTIPSRGDKLKLLELSKRNAKGYVIEKEKNSEKQDPQRRVNRILTALQKDFRTMELPKHIECFDNSNLQGTNPVAACVVFKNGKPSKKEYRLFNIRTVQGPDDYASMEEVVKRRYARLIQQNESLPQLIVIDGGKGQLSSAYSAIKELGIEQRVQVIGIAKKLEEIFFPGDSIPLYLDKNSESLKVIQNARNEAHRFGIAHHRNRRSKASAGSELTTIPGIGEKTMQSLFRTFKSIDRIKTASTEELEMVIGKSKAELLVLYFKQDQNQPKH
ncbi:MAG: excinuclease ABC subunit C [Bacteroidetes bacterium HGW-Bacteroidetes-15]|nr:MAG: excinuclease ABC subunit C [Bacteroidetes bacterium HGW-Bacteroidetes-15]